MTSRIRVLPLLSVLLLLAGCGFQPLYGKQGGETADVQNRLSRVYISNVPDREGQYLRNALIDMFYINGWPQQPSHRLDIAPIREYLTDLDITKSSNATRAQLRLSTEMTLRDAQTGEALLIHPLTAVTSYNILNSQFTTRVSEDNARTNALDQLAGQIQTRMALYFRQP